MKEYFYRVRTNWISFWEIRARRYEFLISFAGLFFIMVAMLQYLQINEKRMGVQVADPLLAMLPTIDMSALTFFLLYTSIITAILMLTSQPHRLLIGFQIYALYAIFRTTTMWLTPLEAPAGITPLIDPLLAWASTGQQLNKDLFFSGHTSTMFILYLVMPAGRARTVFFFGFIAIAISLLFQHVHYSVDILAAPFFCYGAMGITLKARKMLHLDAELHDWQSTDSDSNTLQKRHARHTSVSGAV